MNDTKYVFVAQEYKMACIDDLIQRIRQSLDLYLSTQACATSYLALVSICQPTHL